MATLCYVPNCSSFSSRKFFIYGHRQLRSSNLETPGRIPPKQFYIGPSSPTNKSRGSRNVKSNEQLCDDIRRFLAAVGLPQDHVPSLKEFSQHGRKDLANIVRRRGYKLVRQLLENSSKPDVDVFESNKSLDESTDQVRDYNAILTGQDGNLDDEVDGFSLLAESAKESDHPDLVVKIASANSEYQDSMMNNMVGDTSSSADPVLDDNGNSSHIDSDLSTEDSGFRPSEIANSSYKEQGIFHRLKGPYLKDNVVTEDATSTTTPSVLENQANGSDNELAFYPDDNSNISTHSSSSLSLDEKVAKFIQNGELDVIEGDKRFRGSEPILENSLGMLGGDNSDDLLRSAALNMNGSISTSKQVIPSAKEHRLLRGDPASAKSVFAHSDEYLDVQANERQNQNEISHLKVVLHQKELELFQLKHQIEKEKIALSVMQTKAEAEIRKAQKLVSEKDEELFATEEGLEGLKEVQIQYSGEGDIVEVSGSFNGWHHKIRLDPESSPSIVDPSGSRKSNLWSTVLWLYPGVYEIKFIVDGQWMINHQMESVTQGHICNNILRVDRP